MRNCTGLARGRSCIGKESCTAKLTSLRGENVVRSCVTFETCNGSATVNTACQSAKLTESSSWVENKTNITNFTS